MNKQDCLWCGVEFTPVQIGTFDDGEAFVTMHCSSFCEMESTVAGRFRKRSILNTIYTEKMCDMYFAAKREGKIPEYQSRQKAIHIGVEPLALWDADSNWNIFEPDFVPSA
jgi:hypothetical protein